MEIIPTLLGSATPVGTILVAVVLIYLGKLIPDRIHDKIVALLEDALKKATTRAERAEAQVETLTSTLATHTHLLEAIRAAAEQKEDV